MEIKEITASRKTRITTGHNFAFDSAEIFFSANATVEPGEDVFEATQELQSFVNASLQREVKYYTDNATSTAAQVQEKVSAANEESVPRVSAPVKSQASYTEERFQGATNATANPTTGNATVTSLEALNDGPIERGTIIRAQVKNIWDNRQDKKNPKAPDFNIVFQGDEKMALWGDAPEFQRGDTIDIEGAYKLETDDYGTKLFVNGKQAAFTVVPNGESLATYA